MPTMESATWCRTPAAASAASRLRPAVSKNSSTALSSNDGEFAKSITTLAPATASASPSRVIVLTPVLGDAARTSWPLPRSKPTTFDPMRPLPPMTTIFMDISQSDAAPRWRPCCLEIASRLAERLCGGLEIPFGLPWKYVQAPYLGQEHAMYPDQHPPDRGWRSA